MVLEVFRALFTLADFCYAQNNCKDCAIKEFCSKMPCEW